MISLSLPLFGTAKSVLSVERPLRLPSDDSSSTIAYGGTNSRALLDPPTLPHSTAGKELATELLPSSGIHETPSVSTYRDGGELSMAISPSEFNDKQRE